MHEYPFDPLDHDDVFVELVEDIIGTDDGVLMLTENGEKYAVIVDADHYADLLQKVQDGGRTKEASDGEA
jgi:hypothetical protein